MSDPIVTTKTVAIEPGKIDLEEMIKGLEPFIDCLPEFYRELFQSYRVNVYNAKTRKEEMKQ